MKAMVFKHYGPPEVLELAEINKPSVKDDEVLIKVHATSVSPIDWHFRSGKPFLARIMAGGLIKPKIHILGFDICGEIECVGRHVTNYKQGDQVYGFVPPGRNGANAEYVCVPSEDVLLKPPTLSSEEAAVVPEAAIVALYFLHAANLKTGQKILINGASGGLGTFAVQIAKAFGADVTGVCSTHNLALVQALGADKVIDYRHEDFTQSGQQYHVVFDAVGKSSFSKCRNILEQNGVYVSTILTVQILFHMFFTTLIGKKKAKFLVAKTPPEDFMTIHNLILDGKLKPVIDKRYPLSELAEAHRYAEKGHTKGKIVITIE